MKTGNFKEYKKERSAAPATAVRAAVGPAAGNDLRKKPRWIQPCLQRLPRRERLFGKSNSLVPLYVLDLNKHEALMRKDQDESL